MAFFEHIFLCRPEISESRVKELSAEYAEFIKNSEGKVEKQEYWGLRPLAYPIKRHKKAHYILMNVDAKGSVLTELEKVQSINEDVIRFFTVKVESLNDEPSIPLKQKESGELNETSQHNNNRPYQKNTTPKEVVKPEVAEQAS